MVEIWQEPQKLPWEWSANQYGPGFPITSSEFPSAIVKDYIARYIATLSTSEAASIDPEALYRQKMQYILALILGENLKFPANWRDLETWDRVALKGHQVAESRIKPLEADANMVEMLASAPVSPPREIAAAIRANTGVPPPVEIHRTLTVGPNYGHNVTMLVRTGEPIHPYFMGVFLSSYLQAFPCAYLKWAGLIKTDDGKFFPMPLDYANPLAYGGSRWPADVDWMEYYDTPVEGLPFENYQLINAMGYAGSIKPQDGMFDIVRFWMKSKAPGRPTFPQLAYLACYWPGSRWFENTNVRFRNAEEINAVFPGFVQASTTKRARKTGDQSAVETVQVGPNLILTKAKTDYQIAVEELLAENTRKLASMSYLFTIADGYWYAKPECDLGSVKLAESLGAPIAPGVIESFAKRDRLAVISEWVLFETSEDDAGNTVTIGYPKENTPADILNDAKVFAIEKGWTIWTPGQD